MKNRPTSITLLLLLFCISCGKPSMEISYLKCDYLDNPISINNKSPHLSWQLTSLIRGKSQSAYRIMAASSPELLASGKPDLWDTQKVTSGETQHIVYAGTPLTSRRTVYWKVMVWDETDAQSTWSQPAAFAIGLNPSDWSAEWIGAQEDLYPDSTLTYPAPFLRKEFTTGKEIKQAKAYISGLGFYELYINGIRIGDQVLAPAVTNYDSRVIEDILYQYDDQSTQRVFYNAFDITEVLSSNNPNAVGVILGNGWYNQRDRTVEGKMWYSTPRMIFQLEMEYVDGSTEVIISDPSWKTSTGPLLHDAIFTGEVYDARLELNGWDKADYNDSTWKQALAMKAPTGRLEAQVAPFDYIVRDISPKFIEQSNDSTYLFGTDENISGWVEINIKGNAGDMMKLRFISEENNDFGQTDTYILKGEEIEVWEPRFTWHTFRTFEVISRSIVPEESNFMVKVVNTDPGRAGDFNTDSELFGKINEVYIRTQEANFHGSISSDCPHRERLAYTGDAQVICETSIYTYNMTQFYPKWLNDMEDARNKKTGYVPHTAPFGGGGGGPAWGSAFIIMPWIYYNFYGDVAILKEHYNGMKQWVEYLGTRTDERGIVVREEPNGWCLGDWCTPGKVEIPEPLVNTCYYYHSTATLSKIARLLGYESDAQQLDQIALNTKNAFNKIYFNDQTNHYWEGRQGSDVLPLAFGMVPADKQKDVFNALLTHLEKLDYHFDTGILATPLLLKVLTENGRSDLAFQLMNQRTYPSYGHYVMDPRYTTMWEKWEGIHSRVHPMFGSTIAWFYYALGGIKPNPEQPGMKQFILSPMFMEELGYFYTTYRSLYGVIASNWDYLDDGSVRYSASVPVNTTAEVLLPVGSIDQITESNQPIKRGNGILSVEQANDTVRIVVASGDYTFTISNN